MISKIKQLEKALNDIGITTELNEHAEWYCVDNKVHYGIELFTDIDYGEDYLSFCFTPNGRYITDDCTSAPTVKKG